VLTWGTSGRGNPKLTKGLFPHMEAFSLIRSQKKGRSTVYSITDRGRAHKSLVQMDPVDRKFMEDSIRDRRAEGEIS
jgi:hypothetical protein